MRTNLHGLRARFRLNGRIIVVRRHASVIRCKERHNKSAFYDVAFNEDLVLTEPFTILAGSNPRFLDIWSQSRFTLLDNKNRCQAM